MDEQRSRETRAHAELALVRLLHALGGPFGYAEQAGEADPAADAATLRADAVDVVQRFFTALGIER